MKELFTSLILEDYEKIAGKTEFENQKEIFVKDALIRNTTFIECDKCGVIGNEPNMHRWHFQNCKTVFRSCEQCGDVIPRQGTKPFLYNVKKYCNRKCYMESKKGKPPIVMTDEIKQKMSKIALGQSEIRRERIKKVKPWNTKSKKSAT